MARLTEEDVKQRLITPAIVDSAGWAREQLFMEAFTAGQVIVQGNSTRRGKRGKAIDELNSNAEQFNESLGKWRLNKASEQAKAGMDKAKADIEQARKDADAQLSAVDRDGSLGTNGAVKVAYDELKKATETLAESSFEVKAENYDEAAATIKKADELNKEITDLNAKTKTLADAIAAARAPQTQPAQNQAGNTNPS